MKKYLKELEISGVILMFIGCIMHRFMSLPAGIWACGIGILLWLLVLIYKAFHWKDYSNEMTIKEAQELVDRWIKEYGVRYFSELTNMTVLTEEVGELARIMARRYGDQSWKAEDPRGEDNGKAALGEEMADVLWVLLCLANQTGIDLTQELEKSIEKKTQRDSLRHIHNKKLMA